MATSEFGPIPNETRRERSVAHLLDVAERLFVECGYAATSVERVASEADLTKGSVYFYFASKEGLLDALLSRAQETVFSPSLAILDEADGSALERLARYFNYLGANAESTGRTQRYLLVLMVSHTVCTARVVNDACRSASRRLDVTDAAERDTDTDVR